MSGAAPPAAGPASNASLTLEDPPGALPTQLYAVVFAVVSAEAVVALAFLVQARSHGRSLVRRAVHLAMVFVLLSWVNVLGIFVQSGFFEVAGVAYALATVFLSVWCETLLRIVVYPLFTHAGDWRRIVERASVALCTLMCVVWAGTMLAAAATSRLPDETYNTVVVINILSCMAMACLFSIVFVAASSRTIALLRRTIDKTRSSYVTTASLTVLEDAIHRLDGMRRVLVMISANVAFSTAPFALAQLIAGSAPYAWVMFSIASAANLALIPWVTVRLLARHASGGNSSSDAAASPRPSREKEAAGGVVAVATSGVRDTAGTA